MAKKEKIVETAAADTLHPAAQAISQPDSRTEKLSAILGKLATVDTESLTKIFDGVMAKASEIGHGPGVGDVSGSNKATLSTKPSLAASGPTPTQMAAQVSANAVREDLEQVFEGLDLSEEFKEKIPTIFEAAVNGRVAIQIAEAEELMIAEVEAFKETYEQETAERLDSYLEYVAETWMAENEVAVVNSIRADMAESFVQGLKGLFEEHNVTIPDEQVDVVEALSTQLAEAEAKLDELVTEVSSLKEELSDKTIETAFDEVAEGLVMTQAEKLRTLVEDISFDGTVDDYKKKVSIIKEKHFPVGKQTTVAPQTLSEEVDGAAGDLNENVVLNGPMKKYAEAISKSLRR
jgi:hypothetical protein